MKILSMSLLAGIYIFLAPVVAGISGGVTKDAPKAHAQNETIIFKTGGMALGGLVHEES